MLFLQLLKKSFNRTATVISVENQLDKQLLHSISYNYFPSLVFLSSPVFTFSDIDKHHAAPAPASLKVRLFAE